MTLVCENEKGDVIQIESEFKDPFLPLSVLVNQFQLRGWSFCRQSQNPTLHLYK